MSHTKDPKDTGHPAADHHQGQDVKVAGDHPVAKPHATEVGTTGADPNSIILGHKVVDPSLPPVKVDPKLVAKDPYKAQMEGGPRDDKNVIVPFAATPATLWGTEMTQIIGNVSGGGNMPQNLLMSLNNGRQYCFIGNLALAGQASGSVIGIARIPVPYTMISIQMLGSVSLGTSTIAIGSPSDSSQAGFWSPAATSTVTTPQVLGVYGSLGVPIFVGYDALTGQAATYQPGHQGGGQYDDIILTVGAAALPASGGLRLFFEYII